MIREDSRTLHAAAPALRLDRGTAGQRSYPHSASAPSYTASMTRSTDDSEYTAGNRNDESTGAARA
ncbi:hypothetical protein GCM10023215_56730 [Pseudonocardia yuanmonensis]|uniref:Uncharacterized protein n=1 Tax=Pseudonocardia yuanmonensis TaxID=1095914 RepID=A0ABP8XL64_9PSEU